MFDKVTKYTRFTLFKCSFYVGNHIEKLDQRIQMIQLPRLVRRNFRSLSEHEYFKAHEWKYILLFVAIPLLKDILPERYVNEIYQSPF